MLRKKDSNGIRAQLTSASEKSIFVLEIFIWKSFTGLPYLHIFLINLGSGGGLVGKAVAYDTRDPWFKPQILSTNCTFK